MLIYKMQFPDTSIYIGKTTRKLLDREKEHLSALKSNRHHSIKAQLKYNTLGTPTFSEVETNIQNPTELSLREKFWVAHYDSYNNGLNCTEGGELQGEHAPASKYSLDDYCAIVSFLALTDMNGKEIARELDINYNIINNINSGYTHQYLSDIMPEEYALMISKKHSRNRRVYSDETYYKVICLLAYTDTSFKQISIDTGMSLTNVGTLSSGDRHPNLAKQFPIEFNDMVAKKGHRTKSKAEHLPIISPEGVTFHEIPNIINFCEEFNLNYSSLSKLRRGAAKSHKGWKLVEPSEK